MFSILESSRAVVTACHPAKTGWRRESKRQGCSNVHICGRRNLLTFTSCPPAYIRTCYASQTPGPANPSSRKLAGSLPTHVPPELLYAARERVVIASDFFVPVASIFAAPRVHLCGHSPLRQFLRLSGNAIDPLGIQKRPVVPSTAHGAAGTSSSPSREELVVARG
jgi:hypothetical protein